MNFLAYVIPGIPLGSLKKFSPFGPVVWPALGNKYTNVIFYYIEDRWKVWSRGSKNPPAPPSLKECMYTTLVWSMAKAKRYGVINLTGTYSSLRDSWIQKYSGIRHKTMQLRYGHRFQFSFSAFKVFFTFKMLHNALRCFSYLCKNIFSKLTAVNHFRTIISVNIFGMIKMFATCNKSNLVYLKNYLCQNLKK